MASQQPMLRQLRNSRPLSSSIRPPNRRSPSSAPRFRLITADRGHRRPASVVKVGLSSTRAHITGRFTSRRSFSRTVRWLTIASPTDCSSTLRRAQAGRSCCSGISNHWLVASGVSTFTTDCHRLCLQSSANLRDQGMKVA